MPVRRKDMHLKKGKLDNVFSVSWYVTYNSQIQNKNLKEHLLELGRILAALFCIRNLFE